MALLQGPVIDQPARETYGPARGLSRFSRVSDDAIGTRDTLDAMIVLTNRARTSMPVREAALRATRNTDGKNALDMARGVQAWVKGNIGYIPDPHDYEMLTDPEILLQAGAGDCDDQAMLVAAMLASIGFKVRFVAIGTTMPDQFTHVFTQAHIGPDWLSVETTEPVDVGWWPDGVVAWMKRHIN